MCAGSVNGAAPIVGTNPVRRIGHDLPDQSHFLRVGGAEGVCVQR